MREKLAVIPVPLEVIKWNEQYLGYTWDISKPCLAEKYPNVKVRLKKKVYQLI